MPRIDNRTFYNSALSKYGTSAKGLNWFSKELQELRFSMIVELLPKDKIASLVDAGCGFGDFYFYIKKKNILQKYIGVDSFDKMVAITKRRTGCSVLNLDICVASLPPAEYYISSGALNILTKFETYQFIFNCYRASRVGFIFNVLYGDRESKIYNYVTIIDIKRVAKELNVKSIVIRDNYLDGDITVGFFK